MTAIEEEGIFAMRPLFYPDNINDMKYLLSSSNFKVSYQTYMNPFHPHYSGAGLNIFDYAMIVDKKTNQIIKENEKLTPGESSFAKYIFLIFLSSCYRWSWEWACCSRYDTWLCSCWYNQRWKRITNTWLKWRSWNGKL